MATISTHRERLQTFTNLIETKSDVIDLEELRNVCFENGIPDDYSHHRSIAWKLLLGYLPANKSEWPAILAEKRSSYEQFVNDFILSEKANTQTNDHPLNPAPTSQWNLYFKDNEVLSQIFKDVRRLYPEISFFQQKIKKNYFSSRNGTCDIIGRAATTQIKSSEIVTNFLGVNKVRDEKDKAKYINDFCDQCDFSELIVNCGDVDEYHWQVIARILYIFAKLNPGQGYVQGMNELIGPIYYVFANDKLEWSEHREADTFFCFTILMSEIRDLYNSQLDHDRSSGIVSMMTKLNNLLLKMDNALYTQINQNQSIKPHYYAFRWITLLLSQEFDLPSVLRIWDSLFADRNRFDFLIKICCAMILLLRDEILNNDFAHNVKLLQNFPEKIDCNRILRFAQTINQSV